MRFAISTPNVGPIGDLLELARETEAAGWDGLFVWDHLQLDRQQLFPVHDPWVLLGAMAPYTRRLRLGPLVTPVARRRPWVLAKQVVTLDHLTEGRAVLGVGLGHPRRTSSAPSATRPTTGTGPTSSTRACPSSPRCGPATPSTTKATTSGSAPQFQPVPVQQPRPPIWVAAMWPNRRPLERAARYDGVVPLASDGEPMTPEVLAKVVAVTGRRDDFDVVATAAPGVPVQEYADAGATWLIRSFWPRDGYLNELRNIARTGPA